MCGQRIFLLVLLLFLELSKSYDWVCESCGQGTYPDSEQICRSCPTGCTTCTNASMCSSCDTYNYLDPNTHLCSNCSSYCQSCTGPEACQACDSYYYLDSNNNCQPCTNSLCLTCSSDGSCTSCPSGSYANGNQCLDCMNNCAACSNTNECNTCDIGYMYDGTNCVACSVPNCIACSSTTTCTLCQTEYWATSRGACVPCPSDFTDCNTCNSTGCTSCNYPNQLNPNQTCTITLCGELCESCVDNSTSGTGSTGTNGLTFWPEFGVGVAVGVSIILLLLLLMYLFKRCTKPKSSDDSAEAAQNEEEDLHLKKNQSRPSRTERDDIAEASPLENKDKVYIQADLPEDVNYKQELNKNKSVKNPPRFVDLEANNHHDTRGIDSSRQNLRPQLTKEMNGTQNSPPYWKIEESPEQKQSPKTLHKLNSDDIVERIKDNSEQNQEVVGSKVAESGKPKRKRKRQKKKKKPSKNKNQQENIAENGNSTKQMPTQIANEEEEKGNREEEADENLFQEVDPSLQKTQPKNNLDYEDDNTEGKHASISLGQHNQDPSNHDRGTTNQNNRVGEDNKSLSEVIKNARDQSNNKTVGNLSSGGKSKNNDENPTEEEEKVLPKDSIQVKNPKKYYSKGFKRIDEDSMEEPSGNQNLFTEEEGNKQQTPRTRKQIDFKIFKNLRTYDDVQETNSKEQPVENNSRAEIDNDPNAEEVYQGFMFQKVVDNDAMM